MKRLTFLIFSMLFIFLAGCSSDQVKATLYTPKTYTAGQVSPIKIKIFDNKGNPVKDAKVSVEFNMKWMKMEPITMEAKETGDGLYTGNANLQMEGDYLAEIKWVQDGKTYKQEKQFSIVVSQ